MHRPYPSQNEELCVRLMSYRGCRKAGSLSARDGVIQTWYSSIRREKVKNCGVSVVLRGSARRKAIPRLLGRSRDFESPEYVPRSPAVTHTCGVVYSRPSCVPRSQEREKRPAADRAGHADVKKGAFHTYMPSLQR